MATYTGTASVLTEKSGALRIYVKTDVSHKINLKGQTLKVTWNDETRKLTIEE